MSDMLESLETPSLSELSIQHAKDAGLTYVYDSDCGILRKRKGKGFTYTKDGKAYKDKAGLARIQKLAIPPAWERVWICLKENGHLQATGIDARGRKQYRYHTDWRAARDANKFTNMLVVGRALPGIRRKVTAALNQDGLSKDKVIAAIIRLLDKTGLRVGNDAYEMENHTYGLTTIQKKHFDLHGKEIELDFPAKGGKVWTGSVTDPKVAKVISLCDELPGYRLFKFVDDAGSTHNVSSADINHWLQDVSGEHITAKDFRTWHACALFLEEAIAQTQCDEKLHIKPLLKSVSSQLGNTPAILQKSYVHPELIDLYRTGCFLNKEWDHKELKNIPSGLHKMEALLFAWLEKRYA